VIRDAEFSQLVELCASAIRGERSRHIGPDHDWQRLARLAQRHRVQGLAWFGLSGHDDLDPTVTAELREATKSIARDNLVATSAAAKLLEVFRQEGLALVFVKGLTLGTLAYPQAMLKMSTDIDVLVDPKEIDEVESCLLRLGYEPEGLRRSKSGRGFTAKEWTWVGSNDVVVDLHVRLADNPALLPAISARSSTQDVEVSPDVVLPTFRTEELFAYLCVHGTSSAWFRLKWAADLAAFLHGRSATEVRELHASARSHGAGRCADVALLVVERLFGPLACNDALQSARRDPVARLLAELSLREMTREREPLQRPLGTVLIHAGQLFLDRGLGFPIREFRRQFALLFGQALDSRDTDVPHPPLSGMRRPS
jgi:hypothetical protein